MSDQILSEPTDAARIEAPINRRRTTNTTKDGYRMTEFESIN